MTTSPADLDLLAIEIPGIDLPFHHPGETTMKKSTKNPANGNALMMARTRATKAKDAVSLALAGLVAALVAEAKAARQEKEEAHAILAQLPDAEAIGGTAADAFSAAREALLDQAEAGEALASAAEKQAVAIETLTGGKKPRKSKSKKSASSAAGPFVVAFVPGGQGIAHDIETGKALAV